MDSNILLNTLFLFYEKKQYFELLEILNRKNNEISLRLIDWFTTNYAKKHNTRVKSQNGKIINVYIEYKNQLKAFSKKQFDPFCRRERIDFEKFGMKLKTTIGQLNFFRWALSNNIVNYVRLHNATIENDMLIALNKVSHQNAQRTKNIMIHRTQLSMCATRSFTCANLPCIIVLD
tara:strand:+ start:3119 stop:3646 length:528 start_codon:yes stop_codon:yes gene_type:complete